MAPTMGRRGRGETAWKGSEASIGSLTAKAEQARPASLASGSEDLSQAAWLGDLTE